ncbi:MAG: hypothetical protein ACE37B_13715 [Ilumatobacter sp.]|uniref:hypothetical protein n=1 Tax=Ilumatobacter sp. TaxID=1967498 RepID=UPI00391AF3A6
MEPTESIESIVVESSVVATTTTSPSPSTTSTTSTTEPPPTTTTLEDLRLDIEADLDAGEKSFLLGAATPADPDALSRLEDFNADRALETARDLYHRLASDGLVARPNADIESLIRVVEVLSSEPQSAEVLFCRIDAGVLVNAVGESVDDRPVRYRSRGTVVWADGIWKLSTSSTISSEDGVTSCDD